MKGRPLNVTRLRSRVHRWLANRGYTTTVEVHTAREWHGRCSSARLHLVPVPGTGPRSGLLDLRDLARCCGYWILKGEGGALHFYPHDFGYHRAVAEDVAAVRVDESEIPF